MFLNKVFHVGFLNLENLSARPFTAYSLEGKGLSVSQCPDSWIKIAKLGGSNLYELTKENPSFIIFSEEFKAIALEWCLEHGFLIKANKFRAYFTDENEEEFYMELNSYEQAREESEDVRGVGFYVKAKIT